ncbi:DUF87 domain-containing protein [Mucilaginibacter sp.]|uniref:helicase HerA domain-containing protein n=1 Tax=Mucilaginibacter sp. TaxID=1882438 RepID=UPI002609B126|nr:DUF87 domain-containing protein [Mucilaginibacter sp.]MDB5129817.1 hypothetical protein [Mucilaginibacter sp.]
MDLNIKQRFVLVGIYAAIILSIGYYFCGNWQFVVDSNNKLNSVLIATGLALILSTYITEPYFSKPVDVITRWVAIFLFLIGFNRKSDLTLYSYWIAASIIFIAVALLLILIHGFKKSEKFQRISVDIICKISRPEIVFSLLYFDIVTSLFQNDKTEYPVLIGFGLLLLINKPFVWTIKWVTNLLTYAFSKTDTGDFIGQAIGHESEDFYNVEIPIDNPFRQKILKGKLVYLENITNGVAGMVISEIILLNKKWVQVVSLRDNDKNLVSFNLKSHNPLAGQKTIYSKTNAVYFLNIDELDDEVKVLIQANPVHRDFDNLIGYIWKGSTISLGKFRKLFDDRFLIEKNIGEGTIIQTEIADQEVLYQIIDARTDEETLEHRDSNGFTVGTAQKLGKYDFTENELNTVKWLPEIYTPLFLLNPRTIAYSPKEFIGKLPNTHYGIPIKSPNELVTHNTAILGILGIGKSCLTFELLQKLIETTDVKIFCIDLTNQYARELKRYIDPNLIQEDIPEAAKEQLRINNQSAGQAENISTWGNEAFYKATIGTEINTFAGSAKRVLTLNPDWHQVSKAASSFKITNKIDLTASEKTRIITERIFAKAQGLGETIDARYLIVFEEAHSLVPEWNSVSSDGDKNATNGIAKVILQGRKFGLGSMVVTQRTANISKSILNQCNTIFALRVFDDTGKQFLENYIGSDYSNLLPTLEERHCIAIGKAMKLKQPVILELNDMKDIILPEPDNVIGAA